MIASDDTYSTTTVPPPAGGVDVGAFDPAEVAGRLGYDDTGTSAAAAMATGLPADMGAAFDPAPMASQGGNDTSNRRRQDAGSSAIIGLDAPGFTAPDRVAQDYNRDGLTLARAGAPTDTGRLPVAVGRPASSPDAWSQLDDGLGMKRESASPLAAGGIQYDPGITGGYSSPGGSSPIIAAADPVQVNTYRVPPTPWDEGNYIGGPFDG